MQPTTVQLVKLIPQGYIISARNAIPRHRDLQPSFKGFYAASGGTLRMKKRTKAACLNLRNGSYYQYFCQCESRSYIEDPQPKAQPKQQATGCF